MSGAFTFVAILIFTVAAFSFGALLYVAGGKQKQRMLVAVQLLQAGRILLVHLQRHRGLQVALLSSDNAALFDVRALQDKVIEDFARMVSLDEWLANHEDWHGLTRHWASLSASCHSLTVDNCFEQHCRIVRALLELMDTSADHYKLDTGSRHSDTKVAWREFLELGEKLGQCRALGVRVLAVGGGNSDNRQLRTAVQQVLNAFTEELHASICWRKLNQVKKQELEIFLQFVETHVVQGRGLVAPMEYFYMASDAIDLVYEQFDIEMMRLHRRLT